MDRIIPERPIPSRYDGSCAVCGTHFSVGEYISVFFHSQFNLWRHSNCLQLWFMKPLKYPGTCNDCNSPIGIEQGGYWSKTNGIWCIPCGEKLLPKVTIAYSRSQYENKQQSRNAS